MSADTEHPAIAFVHAFHADLTDWFAGTGDRDSTWASLARACPTDMQLVYPSGGRHTGASFLGSIEDRHGKSPGFRAEIEDAELVHEGAEHALIAYVEVQRGARASHASNRRSALGLALHTPSGWVWRFIQETALPAEPDVTGS